MNFPTQAMQDLEKALNDYLQNYIKVYYNEGIATAYGIEAEERGIIYVSVLISQSIIKRNNNKYIDFKGIINEQEDIQDIENNINKNALITSTWNISHFFTISREDPKHDDRFNYALQTTCLIRIHRVLKGSSEYSQIISKEVKEKLNISKELKQSHIKNIGAILEKIEGIIRNEAEYLKIPINFAIVNELKKIDPETEKRKKDREELLRQVKLLSYMKGKI